MEEEPQQRGSGPPEGQLRSSIPDRQAKLVLQRSGDRCALCRAPLSLDATPADPPVPVGEIAHIAGERPGPARYDAAMSDAERSSYRNLLYLCPNCHTRIDGQPGDWPAGTLQNRKSEHEKWVRHSLQDAISHVTFRELELVIQGIQQMPEPPSTSFEAPDIAGKIRRNGLGQDSREQLIVGLAGAGLVRDFIDVWTKPDPEYPERLRAGFVQEYNRLWARGARGDDLFTELLAFAQNGRPDFVERAAALAVLTYLFALCDVFEP